MILAFYGAGGLGREVLMLARQINQKDHRWDNYIFIDDFNPDRKIKGISVVTLEEALYQSNEDDIEFVVAIGEPILREKIFLKLKERNLQIATLIHPNVYIDESVEIGEGTIICQNVFVSCDLKMGDNILIQPGVNVGHDCTIKNNCVISSGVTVAGNCKIEKNTYVGMNVPIKENICIGCDVIIGMGSAVFKNIPDSIIALGNPARPMKKNEDKKVFK